MKKQQKHYTPEEKVAVLRRHLVLLPIGRRSTRYLKAAVSPTSSYCAQLSSWASPMRSPSGPRM